MLSAKCTSCNADPDPGKSNLRPVLSASERRSGGEGEAFAGAWVREGKGGGVQAEPAGAAAVQAVADDRPAAAERVRR
ncbi:MAG: hypothetical protein IKQ64_05015, partial [Bacteroidales bacterium]|nr:hypothetical protein [Bacteroidales bacterium]